MLPVTWLVRSLREPLFHFLVLGAGLFAAHSYLRGDRSRTPGDRQIVVSAGKVEHLAALFARTWQRPPTRRELQGLVDDYVREEAAYREGISLGLDRNDTIIRRRIRQKLDFVAEDLASHREPTEEELAAYLASHAGEFRAAPRLSFRQVYLGPGQQGQDLEATVQDLVATLRDDPSVDARELGDRTLLDYQHEHLSQREVANLFGADFAAQIVLLEPRSWQGPIPSAFGLHVVIVDEMQPGRPRQLDEVRDAVRREWEHARRQQVTEEFYQGLLEQYDVVVDWPDPAVVEEE
jgi:hypothetical protein